MDVAGMSSRRWNMNISRRSWLWYKAGLDRSRELVSRCEYRYRVVMRMYQFLIRIALHINQSAELGQII